MASWSLILNPVRSYIHYIPFSYNFYIRFHYPNLQCFLCWKTVASELRDDQQS
ncbi:unnamed protein product [Arabidopsis halleri]